MRVPMISRVIAAAVAALFVTGTANAQGAIELRGGANVPTFDIADVAKAGGSFGVGLSTKVSERLWLIGDFDFGTHANKTSGGPDITVNHYIAKLGYELGKRAESPLTVVLNAGIGAMSFGIDGGDTYTYPAINVGAKLIYRVNDRFSLVASPQGDIAFTKEAELGTTNAWVWPFAAGFRITY
ncbi:MAG: outer membrane beta-barrel protein [Gemmatimonadetes bacterium]|nr:outer membrane beta-barrel protein [Gemmatimonadota bacterium]